MANTHFNLYGDVAQADAFGNELLNALSASKKLENFFSVSISEGYQKGNFESYPVEFQLGQENNDSKQLILTKMLDEMVPLDVDTQAYRNLKAMLAKLKPAPVCPTPLTKEELKQISLQKKADKSVVAFRLEGQIREEVLWSMGGNLDSMEPTLNFHQLYVDFDEATFFRTKEELLAYEEYHDIIIPLQEADALAVPHSNDEMTAAYKKAIDSAEKYVILERATCKETLDLEQIASRVTAITCHMAILTDARQILEGNSIVIKAYLEGR